MSIKIRNAVRVILLNNANQLLLICTENFDVSILNGQYNKLFWLTIGGGIEPGESITHAAIREIYEETGIEQHDIKLGPIVWINEIDLMLKGIPIRCKEKFIVAYTHKNNVTLHQLTEEEKQAITKLQWFSIEDIKNNPDVIFPTGLAQHLPAIIAGNYPVEPIDISLKK